MTIVEPLFEESIKQYYDLCQQCTACPWRKKAWSQWCELGLPNSNTAEYRHFPTRTFQSLQCVSFCSPTQTVACSPPPPFPVHQLAFADGRFLPECSRHQLPSAVHCLTLEEGMKRFRSFLFERWKTLLKEARDPFFALNGALHRHGLFLYIPPHCEIALPISLSHSIGNYDHPAFSCSRTHILAGRGAKVTFWIDMPLKDKSSSFPYSLHQLFDLHLDPSAHVDLLFSPSLHCKQLIMDSLHATLSEKSHLNLFHFHCGEGILRQEDRITLLGKESRVQVRGIALAEKQSQCHYHVSTAHRAPASFSEQQLHGIATGQSKSVFKGEMIIASNAIESMANQHHHQILLSDRAKAFVEPTFDIDTDNVQAAHGAAVGPLKEEEKQYLQMRGISEKRAESLLLQGFAKTILDPLAIACLKERLSSQLTKKIDAALSLD